MRNYMSKMIYLLGVYLISWNKFEEIIEWLFILCNGLIASLKEKKIIIIIWQFIMNMDIQMIK